jgi:hypothetical protein
MTGPRIIAGHNAYGELYVKERDGHYTVERGSYGGCEPEVLCSTIHREHALAYYERIREK